MANKNYESFFSATGINSNGKPVSVTIKGRPGMTDSQMNHMARDFAKSRGLSNVTGVCKSSKHK